MAKEKPFMHKTPLQRFPTPDVEEKTPKLTLASREAMESIFIPHIVGKYRIEVNLEYGLVALLASNLKPRRASKLKNENVNITRENTQLKRDLDAGHGKSKRLKVDLKELKREIASNKVKSTRVCTMISKCSSPQRNLKSFKATMPRTPIGTV
ncbi:hypothetical protein Fot_06364 [Forsythia ovata]|uniref:Uncharacterized protein n=1 Tax=Forsythia ovata TaxID=205694 RepID=A0ABD1WTF8_9LAMI